MTKLSRVFSVAVLSAVLAAGCAARGVRIAELKNRPDKYERKTVAVEGVVTNSWGAGSVLGGFLPFQAYSVDDGSGQITVVSRSPGRIVKGSRVRVKGKVSELAVFGGQSFGLHLQEGDRKIKD